jgi:hypothetical protein
MMKIGRVEAGRIANNRLRFFESVQRELIRVIILHFIIEMVERMERRDDHHFFKQASS